MGWLFRSSSFIHCGTGARQNCVASTNFAPARLVIDHEAAALSFQSLASAHQLLPLSMNGPGGFLFFSRTS